MALKTTLNIFTSDNCTEDIDLSLGLDLLSSLDDFFEPSIVREDNDLTMSDGFSLLLIFLSSSLDVPDEERLLFDIVLSLVVSGFIWPSGAVAAVAIVSTVSLDNILDELSSCKSSSSISNGEALLLAVVNPRLYTIGDRTTPILDWCNMLVG